ncbi:2-succinyl-6-hydroxy-2,4-cyclohexadiene-1-carboxylate synthase [Vibrio palustris]|uniref:Putative 2-succinyl-6-hydroxy-2,4-cyclohexadiene-1-carboxylate synthase n=1 Tax=Vibrio palustris TaxID=1918946 RepID=A0A1R4B3E9_9VIBR|nr:2-succinyl-6-hydroxy-2,4-cyclohexadiene-1-carboxylate synthase [Vibrio palustris]SJL83436.1 2-succinyl-6-hydroxy-2, 4-cyclohexadiene-1-carboxylate synthase [Vibrio palustris]
MLYSRALFSQVTTNQPVIVWLHGLLGSGDDWSETLYCLSSFAHFVIDLPGHGGSQALECDSLPMCAEQVVTTIQAQLGARQPVIIVGYSLGARIAMAVVNSDASERINIQAVLLEGGNVGLNNEPARVARWQQDSLWAQRFACEPIETVLEAWYQQPVFGTLNTEQRNSVITARRNNVGSAIAKMLTATSLATQADMLPVLQRSPLPIHYVCGEKDTKFQSLASEYALPTSVLANAGHNVHKEQPQAFAALVEEWVTTTTVSCS